MLGSQNTSDELKSDLSEIERYLEKVTLEQANMGSTNTNKKKKKLLKTQKERDELKTKSTATATITNKTTPKVGVKSSPSQTKLEKNELVIIITLLFIST